MPKRPFFLTLTLVITILSISFTLYADSQAGQRAYLPIVRRSQPTPTPGPANGTPLVKINFQPASAALPVGYQLDSGAPFASRGNGFSYGWNKDTSSLTRDRNAPNAPSEALMSSLQAGFSGAKEGILSTAYTAESGAVAMYDELLGQLQGKDGAVLVASIQMAEARHCTVLATMNGQTDLAQLLVDDEADALQANG